MIFPKCLKCRRLPVGAKSIRFPKRSPQMSIIKTCYIRACNRKCSYDSQKCPNIILLENNYMHRTTAHFVHAEIFRALKCSVLKSLLHNHTQNIIFYACYNAWIYLLILHQKQPLIKFSWSFSTISQTLRIEKDINDLFIK